MEIISEEEIQSFEEFFSNMEFPPTPYKLMKGEKIRDFKHWIEGHIAVIRDHKDKSWMEPYLNRLVLLSEKLSKRI